MRNKEIAKKIASLPNSLQKAQTVNSNKILGIFAHPREKYNRPLL